MSVVQQTPMVPVWFVLLLFMIVFVMLSVLLMEQSTRLEKDFSQKLKDLYTDFNETTRQNFDRVITAEREYVAARKESDERYFEATRKIANDYAEGVKEVEEMFAQHLKNVYTGDNNGS